MVIFLLLMVTVLGNFLLVSTYALTFTAAVLICALVNFTVVPTVGLVPSPVTLVVVILDGATDTVLGSLLFATWKFNTLL